MQLKERNVYFCSQSESLVLHGVQLLMAKPEAAGFILSTVRKMIEKNMGTEFTSSFISSQDSSLQNSAALFYGSSHCFRQLSLPIPKLLFPNVYLQVSLDSAKMIISVYSGKQLVKSFTKIENRATKQFLKPLLDMYSK